nr:MAG TPA: hypothetical protein [Caudoviricetes sp.]
MITNRRFHNDRFTFLFTIFRALVCMLLIKRKEV